MCWLSFYFYALRLFYMSSPSWLSSWPTTQEFNKIFPIGIRTFYNRHKARLRYSSITWLEDGANIYVDQHKCQFKLVNGKWERLCGCGTQGGNCPHLYALVQKVNEAYSAEIKKNSQVKKQPITKKFSADAFQHTFDSHAQQTKTTTKTKAQKSRTRGLVVEADIKTTPGHALIRFYLVEKQKRRLLKLSELRNQCAVAGYNHSQSGSWPEDDRTFMKWLGNRFTNKKNLEYSKLTAWKLERSEFENWLNHWQEHLPSRFIERDTQEVISSANNLIKIRFELEIENDRTTISAVARFKNGKKCYFHELAREMSRQKLPKEEQLVLGREYILQGAIGKVDYPIESKTMWELFSKKNPSMKTEFVCDHFPCLIEDRLDIVGGPAVEQVNDPATLVLAVTSCKGGLIFKALLNGSPLTNNGEISYNGSSFVVRQYHAQYLEQVQSFLEQVGGDDKQAVVKLDNYNLKPLCAFWDALPEGLNKSCDKISEMTLEPQRDGVVKVNATARDQWVDLDTSWHVASDSIYTENINSALSKQNEFVWSREGHWIRLDLESIRASYNKMKDSGFIFSSQRVIASEAVKLLEGSEDLIFTDDAIEQLVFVKQSMRDEVFLTQSFKDCLRPYQVEGFNFLESMSRYGIGCVLADDMGLGKTIQILALLVANRQVSNKASLVCSPASVLHVWQNEAKKFAPELRTVICHGNLAKRQRILNNISDYDLIITSYGSARNDVDLLLPYEFDSILLDEAQHIRNPKTKAYQAIRRLNGRMRIAISGTPVENKVTDLWSIVNFTNPGLLGTLDKFKKNYEFDGSSEVRAKLASRVAPLIMRRTKEVVASDLPPKTIETISVELSKEQEELYHSELANLKTLKHEGGNNSIQMLAVLTKLRQICDSPQLVGVDASSPKLDAMVDMLKVIMEEGHSALVFSSFTSMLDIIKVRFEEEGINHRMLTGKTPIKKRQDLVKSFNEGKEEEVFLLSIKAAGTGLTLTKADYVFIFDPWWNPATEAQAIDRTHRIGQTKPVIAYKMVATNSLEEQIVSLQEKKQELFDELINEQSNVSKTITNELLEVMMEEARQ